MNYEWDAGKAAGSLKKHGVSFEDASTVFLDPLALTFFDPAHSIQEHHEITIGILESMNWCLWRTLGDWIEFGSSAPGA